MVWRLALILFLMVRVVTAGDAKIIKVLPHLLDEKGRHTVSPSLLDRDAYQVYLRENPEKVSALRFDIQWKGGKKSVGPLKFRLDLRGSKTSLGQSKAFEMPIEKTGWFADWLSLRLTKEQFEELGNITAWRATIWDGPMIIAEQESFLW